MLDVILQGLREVEGVQGAMVVDSEAAVLAHRAHAIYDLSVLQQVARSVVHSVESVQLIQDDWDVLTASFGEGKLLLRSLRPGMRPDRFILAVIADATLNVAFLGVALRVAAGKLLAELDGGRAASQSGPIPVAFATGSTGRIPIDQTRSELARSGTSWSGATSSNLIPTAGSSAGFAASPGSGMSAAFSTSSGSGVGSGVSGASDVGVMDAASATFLTAATKALAASVGPMAKVFVKEAVRKVCGARPFSRADGPALLAHLASTIDDQDDRAMFQRATRGL